MIPPRSILVATDYGAPSEMAVETAAALATRFRAELHVVHVVEEPAYAFPFPTVAGLDEAAQKQLDKVLAGLRARMLHASGILRKGTAWYEIGACATDLSADLVVIGSQGRRGLPRFVMGSVAEQLVRTSRVPVMTIHPTDHVAILEGGMDRFRHVLAPVDFDEPSVAGIELATSLAVELESELTLVHAHEWPAYVSSASDDFRAQARAAAQRALGERLVKVRSRLPRAEATMEEGVPWRVILDTAKERGADLIVLSTHGRRGLQRALMGSVAEKIVRLAPVPVITQAVADLA